MDSRQNAYNFTKNMNAWSSTIHSKYTDQVNFKYKFIFRYWTLLLSEKKRRQKNLLNLAQLSYENPSKRKQFCQVMAKEAVKEKFSTTYLGLHEDKQLSMVHVQRNYGPVRKVTG